MMRLDDKRPQFRVPACPACEAVLHKQCSGCAALIALDTCLRRCDRCGGAALLNFSCWGSAGARSGPMHENFTKPCHTCAGRYPAQHVPRRGSIFPCFLWHWNKGRAAVQRFVAPSREWQAAKNIYQLFYGIGISPCFARLISRKGRWGFGWLRLKWITLVCEVVVVLYIECWKSCEQ